MYFTYFTHWLFQVGDALPPKSPWQIRLELSSESSSSVKHLHRISHHLHHHHHHHDSSSLLPQVWHSGDLEPLSGLCCAGRPSISCGRWEIRYTSHAFCVGGVALCARLGVVVASRKCLSGRVLLLVAVVFFFGVFVVWRFPDAVLEVFCRWWWCSGDGVVVVFWRCCSGGGVLITVFFGSGGGDVLVVSSMPHRKHGTASIVCHLPLVTMQLLPPMCLAPVFFDCHPLHPPMDTLDHCNKWLIPFFIFEVHTHMYARIHRYNTCRYVHSNVKTTNQTLGEV